jgi:hypothetical protein
VDVDRRKRIDKVFDVIDGKERNQLDATITVY